MPTVLVTAKSLLSPKKIFTDQTRQAKMIVILFIQESPCKLHTNEFFFVFQAKRNTTKELDRKMFPPAQ